MSSESPFLKYRQILVHESYSTAKSLQDFIVSCYNPDAGQFRGATLTNFDEEHLAIFFQLARHYHAHGEDDPEFMETAKAILDARRANANRIFRLLEGEPEEVKKQERLERSAARALYHARIGHAQDILMQLEELRAIDPDDYEYGPADYSDELNRLLGEVDRLKAAGFLDSDSAGS